MPVFVILSLAIAVMAVAVLVVIAAQLVRSVRRLGHAAVTVRDTLTPLADELQAEVAVTTTESEALRRRVDAWQAQRTARRRDKEGLREGLRRSVRGD